MRRSALTFLLFAAFAFPSGAAAATNDISTVAGTGNPGFSGDGGPATAGQLLTPTSVAAMPDGGFLIGDQFAGVVRRVSPAGTITSVAGDGTFGFSGDGGPATAAELSEPTSVAATADGGFLIADDFADVVRRVSPAGTITTVAGDGTFGFSGDGGPATAAQLHVPTGVAATAAGGFLIADLVNNRVRFVDANLGGPPAPPGPPATPAPPVPPRPPAPSGPPGPPIVQHRLTVTLAASRLRSRPLRHVLVRYRVTTSARVRATITRRGTRPVRSSLTVGTGRHTLRLRAPRRRGRYTLTLTALSSDGQRAGDRARLDVTD